MEYLSRGLVQQQIVGFEGLRFYARRLNWIGSASQDAKGAWFEAIPPYKRLKDVIDLPKWDIPYPCRHGKGGIEGVMGWCWSSIKSTVSHYLREKFITLLADKSPLWSPELKGKGVPRIFDIPISSYSRDLLEICLSIANPGRSFAALPGVPADRVRELRETFARTMKDPRFLSEARKEKLEIRPLCGNRVQELLEGIFNSDGKLLVRVREILK